MGMAIVDITDIEQGIDIDLSMPMSGAENKRLVLASTINQIEVISLCLGTQSRDFVFLGLKLKEFKDQQLYTGVCKLVDYSTGRVYVEGYNEPEDITGCYRSIFKDVYEFCYYRFNLEKSIVKRYIQVVERWCDIAPVEIKESFSSFSYSQLVELLSIPDNLIYRFDESMTIKEMRTLKRTLLKKETVIEENNIPAIKDMFELVEKKKVILSDREKLLQYDANLRIAKDKLQDVTDMLERVIGGADIKCLDTVLSVISAIATDYLKCL